MDPAPPEPAFSRPLAAHEGIYRALERRPRLPLAQSSNFSPFVAALYEPLWRARSLGILTLGGYSTARELALLTAWLEPKPGEAILDAACSAGLYARTLLRAEPTLRVHALDMSLPFLHQARRYALREGLEPVLVQADVRALPYDAASFDAVVCGGSLNEFTDPARALAEFARVLKPGGRLWLMYLARASNPLGRALQGAARLAGIRFPRPDEVARLARDAGLELRRAQRRGVVVMALFHKLAG